MPFAESKSDSYALTSRCLLGSPSLAFALAHARSTHALAFALAHARSTHARALAHALADARSTHALALTHAFAHALTCLTILCQLRRKTWRN